MHRRAAIATGLTGVATLAPIQAKAQEPQTQFVAQVTVADASEAAAYLTQMGLGMEGLGKGGIIDAFSLTPSPKGFDLLVVYRIKDVP